MPTSAEEFNVHLDKLIKEADANKDDRAIIRNLMKTALSTFELDLKNTSGVVLASQLTAIKTFSDLIGDQFEETKKTAEMVARKKEQDDDNRHAEIIADMLLQFKPQSDNSTKEPVLSPGELDEDLEERFKSEELSISPGEDETIDLDADDPIAETLIPE